MVPQPQIYFAKDNFKNLAGPMSILNIARRISRGWIPFARWQGAGVAGFRLRMIMTMV